MAIRLRTNKDGVRIALCADNFDEKLGDVYLNDNDHYALAAKFSADWYGQLIDGLYIVENEAVMKERRIRKKIKCACCNKKTKISDLDLIQTHYYTEPSGCSGGDYWTPGEVNYICPLSGIRNRILFNNFDVPYKERHEFSNDPEGQFIRLHLKNFASVTKEHEEPGLAMDFVNNYFVDDHRKGFGLVAKRKKKS